MNNTEFLEILDKGILKWNFVEDITGNEEQNNNDTEKDDDKKSILEEIFPPRVWTRVNNENKVITLRQTISKEPSDRASVSNMVAALNHSEKFYRFKKIGICETRNYMHNLFFDEVLRQVIILNEDLGAMLYRIHKGFKNLIFILKFMFDKAVLTNNLYPDSDSSDVLNDINMRAKSNARELDVEFTSSNGPTVNPEVEDVEEAEEVEELTRINNDLKIKCRISQQRYADKLKRRESGEDYKVLVLLKMKYKMLSNNVKRSTEQLKEQINMTTPSTQTSYLIQSKDNPTEL